MAGAVLPRYARTLGAVTVGCVTRFPGAGLLRDAFRAVGLVYRVCCPRGSWGTIAAL